jgi:hypothetical protein
LSTVRDPLLGPRLEAETLSVVYAQERGVFHLSRGVDSWDGDDSSAHKAQHIGR